MNEYKQVNVYNNTSNFDTLTELSYESSLPSKSAGWRLSVWQQGKCWALEPDSLVPNPPIHFVFCDRQQMSAVTFKYLVINV